MIGAIKHVQMNLQRSLSPNTPPGKPSMLPVPSTAFQRFSMAFNNAKSFSGVSQKSHFLDGHVSFQMDTLSTNTNMNIRTHIHTQWLSKSLYKLEK